MMIRVTARILTQIQQKKTKQNRTATVKMRMLDSFPIDLKEILPWQLGSYWYCAVETI